MNNSLRASPSHSRARFTIEQEDDIMHFGPAYNMQPPYLVIRRLPRDKPANDFGDYEYFVGHCARVWMPWLKPYPKWEPMHLPHHDGLYRFKDADEARVYMLRHMDMGLAVNEQIEFVTVSKSGDTRPYWEKEAPYD
jgi:hypothetical protein